jgi:hypothetical protein
MSHRIKDGRRRNQWGQPIDCPGGVRGKDGSVVPGGRPSHFCVNEPAAAAPEVDLFGEPVPDGEGPVIDEWGRTGQAAGVTNRGRRKDGSMSKGKKPDTEARPDGTDEPELDLFGEPAAEAEGGNPLLAGGGGGGRNKDGTIRGAASRRANGNRRGGYKPHTEAGVDGTLEQPEEEGDGGSRTYRFPAAKRPHAKARPDGTDEQQLYTPPVLANPGTVIDCKVGGGLMGEGSAFAHHNEAPFPEGLAERFILSFCPPGGIVLDPFAGSGTTLAVAIRHGRRAIGCDLRRSQVDLANRRISAVTPDLFSDLPLITHPSRGEA